MTKVIVIGQSKPFVTTPKPIVFEEALLGSNFEGHKFRPAVNAPNDYDTIELITKKYFDDRDLMFAYDADNRAAGVLYLGQFNDGVVK